jgi:glutamate-1-semialdehyde aminotransferase
VLTLRSQKAAEAAALVCELSGNERAAFVQSGSEAVMTALRLARHATGKKKIIIFENSYHGLGDGVLVRNHIEDGKRVARPVVAAIPQCMVAEVMVLPYGDPESLAVIRAHRDQLAAVLTEPVQSRAPQLQPRAFLHELRALTAEADIALVFDEIITGFRCAPGGAQAWFGVQADLCTYGKVVGNGVPIGVVAGKSRFMDAVDGGQWQYGDRSYPQTERTFFGGTHAQNPLAMAAAHAVLSHLKQEGPALQRELNRTCEEMVGAINGFLRARQLDLQLVHFSSLFRFVSGRNNLFEMSLLMYHLWDKGVLLSDIGNNFLSTAHSAEDVGRIVAAVQQSIEDLQSGGYFLNDGSATAAPAAKPAPVSPAIAQPAARTSLLRSIVDELDKTG